MSTTASPVKRTARRSNSMSTRGAALATTVASASGSGSQATPSRSNSKGKQRAVFCDIVIEDAAYDKARDEWMLPDDIANVLPSLGRELDIPTSSPAFPTTPSKLDSLNLLAASQSRPPDPERLRCILDELLKTEENYVRRLRALNDLYAQPLRQFAQRRDEEIIPSFAAKQIFANVEAILAANRQFLNDLRESLCASETREHWASCMLRHLQTFETIYPKYMSNLESAKATEREQRTRNKVFARFLDRTREAAADGQNNSSLESLLIEPAQRIPRYLLILKSTLKELPLDDICRPTIVSAMDIASQIATLDEDEQTRRAAALYGLAQVIDGLPAKTTSSGRYFIDCIDVLDTPLSISSAASTPGFDYSAHSQDLFCTLFLFNDQILVAKRDTNDKTGRALVGLDDINKLATDMRMQRAGSASRSPWKGRAKTMKFRGAFDLGELVAKDLGAYDFALFLSRPPLDYASDKWNGRPLRNFRLVKPETLLDKSRFLRNIWQALAHLKAQGQGYRKAILLRTQDLSLYWNLYDRRSYEEEYRKSKIALHFDGYEPKTVAPRFPAPQVVVHAQFYREAECSYTTMVAGTASSGSEDRICDHFSAVTRHILEKALSLGLYEAPPRTTSSGGGLQRQPSRSMSGLSGAKALGASTSRNVLDFMLAPAADPGSPRRTLSRGSKASTADSRIAASIFSSDYAPSSSGTSVLSHSPRDDRASVLSRQTSQTVHSAPAKTAIFPHHNRSASITGLVQPQQTSRSLYAAGGHSRSSRQLVDAEMLGESPRKHEDSDADLALLRRTVSDGSLRPSGSAASLARSRSGTLGRSESRQGMRIDEEDEDTEELLGPRTPPRNLMSPIDDRLLSPTGVQRSGTLSRPMGPRQLGSRSPANSPRPITSTAPVRNISDGSNDENDPFVLRDSSFGASKKRHHNGEDDDASSVSSKRALHDVTSPERDAGLNTPDRKIEKRASFMKDDQPRSARSRFANKELQRVGSLPRSPHTRALYQQSQDEAPGPSPVSKSPTSGHSRIPRKPVPSVDIPSRQREVLSESSIASDEQRLRDLEEENCRLRAAVASGELALRDLKDRLEVVESSKEQELDRIAGEAAKMANERIDEHAAAMEIEMASLRTENNKLKNEKRALQVLLKRPPTPTRL